MQRRAFLRRAAQAAACAILSPRVQDLHAAPGFAPAAGAASRPQPATPFPYVDGLTFPGPDPADNARSGLSAFLRDVSAVEAVPTADGSPRWYRSFEACARSITRARRELAAGAVPGTFLATRGSEIADAHASSRTAVFFQFQGAEPIGEQLDRLDLFYELGLRIQQITHHHDNAWGGGAIERTWTGLTPVGHEAVERLETLGMIADLSHASDPTCRDVLRASTRPVILSHGAARALVDNARCTPDDVIRGIADSGGVMGVFMMSFWLTTERVPTVDAYIRQIRHVANVGGIDAVAIANDYTVAGELAAVEVGNDNARAVQAYLPWWDSVARSGVLGFDERPQHVVIPELNDVRRMLTIHDALERGGFAATDIEKVMGGNWIRVLTGSLG